MSSSSDRIYSLGGTSKGLKLESAQDAQPYIEELDKTSSTLEEIQFGGNSLGIGACEAFGKWIGDAAQKNKCDLKVANLDDIFTGRLITEIPQALDALCKGLAHHKNLHTIDVSDNALGGRVVHPISDLLATNSSIQHLIIANNGLGPQGGQLLAQALLDMAQFRNKEDQKTPLKTFICARNRLEDGSSKLFAQAFKTYGTLEKVALYQNGIRMQGIETLLKEGLNFNPNLTYLDIQDNTLTLIGSRALASCLSSWPKLKHLNLADCLLRPRGSVTLLTALAKDQTCSKLEYLNLQSNELDYRSIPLLTSAVSTHLHNIQTIDLDGNRVDPEDTTLDPLREALEKLDKADVLTEIEDVEEVDPDEEESEEEEELEQEKEESEPEQESKPKQEKVQQDKQTENDIDLLTKQLEKDL